jgi:hypothetical protein
MRKTGNCASKKGYFYCAGGTYYESIKLNKRYIITLDLIVNDIKWDYVKSQRKTCNLCAEYYKLYYPKYLRYRGLRGRIRDELTENTKPLPSHTWGAINYEEPEWLRRKYAKPSGDEPEQLEFDFDKSKYDEYHPLTGKEMLSVKSIKSHHGTWSKISIKF